MPKGTIYIVKYRDACKLALNDYYVARGQVNQGFSMAEMFKIFDPKGTETIEVQNGMAKLRDDSKRRDQINFDWTLFSRFTFDALRAVLICFLLGVAARGELSAGDYIAIMSYSTMVFDPVWNLVMLYKNIQPCLVQIADFLQLMRETPEPDAQSEDTDSILGGITFDNVSFSIDDKAILSEVSLEIPAGTAVGVVGRSGAGKTTFARLISRLYDPTHGRILFDLRDASSIPRGIIRGSIATVTQDSFIIHDTIAQNIRVGRFSASDEEIIRAAKMANIHERIVELDDGENKGYGFVVEEDGRNLSGGECQRLAIARAFLQNPKLLIMDEPTSNLDAETEWLVVRAMERLMDGRTTIIIAHRLSTLRKCSHVIVLEKGRVLEQGLKADLEQVEGGAFAKMQKLAGHNKGVFTDTSEESDELALKVA